MDEMLVILRILGLVVALGLALFLLNMGLGWMQHDSVMSAIGYATRQQEILEAIRTAIREIAAETSGARTRYIQERAWEIMGSSQGKPMSGAEFWTGLERLEEIGEVHAEWGVANDPGGPRPRLYWGVDNRADR